MSRHKLILVCVPAHLMAQVDLLVASHGSDAVLSEWSAATKASPLDEKVGLAVVEAWLEKALDKPPTREAIEAMLGEVRSTLHGMKELSWRA